MKSRARWADTAIDLSNDLELAARQLTVGQLSDATGLSPRTIEDSLTREKITHPDNPRGALDRPAYMCGGMPLWSHKQLADFLVRAKRQQEPGELPPLVTENEADRLGYASAEDVAKLYGLHIQTVRRWESTFGDYPPCVARRSKDGRPGVPDHLRELDKVIEWADARNIRVPEGQAT